MSGWYIGNSSMWELFGSNARTFISSRRYERLVHRQQLD